MLYLGGLGAAGAIMLLFLQIRVTIYNGGTWTEAFQKLDVNDAVVGRGDEARRQRVRQQLPGRRHDFENGRYDYGTGHLGLFLHWVPRAIWPNKPAVGEGDYTGRELFDDVEKASGVRLLGSGAAYTGVADSFLEYGVFCPLFWFLLSALVGLVYRLAILTRSPWWMFCYAGFLCATHWLVSQSFSAAFVPGMYFQMVPLGVFALVWIYRRMTAAPTQVRPAAPAPRAGRTARAAHMNR